MEFEIPVPHWLHSQFTGRLFVESDVDAVGVVKPVYQSVGIDEPLTLLVAPADLNSPPRRGSITFRVRLRILHPYVYDWDIVPIRRTLSFECDDAGELSTRLLPTGIQRRDDRYTIRVALRIWKDNELGWPRKVAAPRDIRVLHMTMAIGLEVNSASNGFEKWEFTADGRAGHPLGETGSVNLNAAFIDTFAVELVQPVSKTNGVFYRVLFDKDSTKFYLRRGDGSDFELFIRQELLNPYEVRVALKSGLLNLRGECRASATYKGGPTERSRYNQELSEKRRKVVVDYMNRKGVPNPDSKLLVAVGDRYGKTSEEDPNERRCDVQVTRNDLLAAVQRLWEAERYLGQ